MRKNKMTANNTGERIASLETQVNNTNEKIDTLGATLGASVLALHAKVDSFITLVTQNYVPKSTFEEAQKNKFLERVLTIVVTAIIVALTTYFFKGK